MVPLSFSFMDGLQTITNLSALQPDTSFPFSTSLTGEITAWYVLVDASYPYNVATIGACNASFARISLLLQGTSDKLVMPTAKLGPWQLEQSIARPRAVDLDDDGGRLRAARLRAGIAASEQRPPRGCSRVAAPTFP